MAQSALTSHKTRARAFPEDRDLCPTGNLLWGAGFRPLLARSALTSIIFGRRRRATPQAKPVSKLLVLSYPDLLIEHAEGSTPLRRIPVAPRSAAAGLGAARSRPARTTEC